MNDLTTEPADAPDDTPLARMLDPKAFEPPAGEPPKTFGSDSHGIGQAADALSEERKRREKPEPKIRQRRLADDAPATLSIKDAASRVAFNRVADRALDRMQRNPGENAWVSGNITRQEMDAEAEPSVVEYADRDQRVNARQAARDLAEYRRTTAPAEEADKAARIKLLAELGADDLVAETAEQTPDAVTEQPAYEPPVEQPQSQQPDPAEVARQQAQHELEAIRYLRGATQAEHLLLAEAQKWTTGYHAEFPGVNSMTEVQKLSPDRQARWAQYQDAWQKLNGQYQQATTARELTERRITEAHQAHQAQELQRYKAEQDALAAKSIPEISGDPETAYHFKAAAAEVLKEVGITQDAYRSLPPDVRRAVHSHEFQKLVADATRYRQGKARAHEVSAQPLPPVQRPGVARDRGDRAQADVSHLSERIDRARPGSDRQLRLAAQMVATRRANRGR